MCGAFASASPDAADFENLEVRFSPRAFKRLVESNIYIFYLYLQGLNLLRTESFEKLVIHGERRGKKKTTAVMGNK